jgi:two-component system NtrC family sensor kinase
MLQTSNILVVGAPVRPQSADLGVDSVNDYRAAQDYLEHRQPAVLLFGCDDPKMFADFCTQARAKAPNARWILSAKNLSPEALLSLMNQGSLHALVDDWNDLEIEDHIRSALEASGEVEQTRQLLNLFGGQTQQLKRLFAELEQRVNRRQRTLAKTTQRLEATRTRLSCFHRALIGIHRASGIVQAEKTLLEALRPVIPLAWVRVRFEQQSTLTQQPLKNALIIDLPIPDAKTKAQAVFAREKEEPFSSDETEFLYEISEAMALALDRWQRLEQAEALKSQWQATFDAIPHPLCLVNEAYEIEKLNLAFQGACSPLTFQQILGKNCFEIFFGKKKVKQSVLLEKSYTFRQTRQRFDSTEHFEVIGQSVGAAALILLRPITDEIRFERRILDASKLAELGTIGSSIAHELNNPLGGMLSFLQLILMEIKASDEIYADVKSMEEATLRCRDIVQNLLSFARKQDIGEMQAVSIEETILRAAKLMELKAKSKGIAITVDTIPVIAIWASPNSLSQALCNIVQNGIDAIEEKLKAQRLYQGQITITTEVEANQVVIKVSDNGTGILNENLSQIFNPLFTTRDPNHYSGMGLTTAFNVVAEHSGRLEILSQTGFGTTAIITLPIYKPG